MTRYLNDITVASFSTKPDDLKEYIQEESGWNIDINAGFGGSYVYLKPKWGSKENAISSIGFARFREAQHQRDDFRGDLAKGAGGDYRYIQVIRNGKTAITDIKLWRTAKSSSLPNDEGYESYCSDINGARKGDYLYLCW